MKYVGLYLHSMNFVVYIVFEWEVYESSYTRPDLLCDHDFIVRAV